MNKLILFLNIFIFLIVELTGQFSEQVSPAFPEIFSEYDNLRDFCMSPSSDEIFFTILSPAEDISAIAFVKMVNGSWTKPEMISFSGNYRDIEPFISPDGLRLYFSSDRPPEDSVHNKSNYDIWYVTRGHLADKWSEPINIGAPVNTKDDEFYPSLALNNNIYFTCDKPGMKKKDDIYFCRWNGNIYSEPISLSDSVNTTSYEFNSFIAPDESYIIFSGYNREGGQGSGDLYISYRKDEKTWSQVENFGPLVNSAQMDYCPFIDSKTKTLYFTSKRSEVKYNNFKSLEDLNTEINKYQNGFSRIYKISLQNIPDK